MIAFSHPWALLLALPAAWLLWRSRRRSVQTFAVANLFLWMDAPDRAAERRRERRAPPPWLTWLQAAVLVALAIAIAAPTLSGSRPDAILIVDVSTSMTAREGASSRLEIAQQSAREWLRSQPPGRLIRIIGAGAQPTAIALARAGSTEAAAAIDHLSAQDGPDRIADAIEAGRRESSGPVVVITDRRAPENAAPLGIEWRQVGSPADNVAITTLAVNTDGSAVLEVTNFGGAQRTVGVLVKGGVTAWRRQVELAPSAAQAFTLPRAGEGSLTAAIEIAGGGNAVTIDDSRRIERNTSRARVSLLVNDPRVNAALSALTDIDLDVSPRGTGGHDVVVTAGSDSGGIPSLVFLAGGAVPAITRRETGGKRVIEVAVDLENSAWTLTPAFPIFVADSIDWLSGRTADSLTAERAAAIAESDVRRDDPPSLGDLELTASAPEPRSLWIPVTVAALLGVLGDLALRRRGWPVRLIAAAATAVAVVGAPLPFGGSGRAAAIALDASASVAGNQRKAADRARREVEAATSEDHAATVRFGGAETNIAAGIRSARAELPASGDRRILLISDGQETSGDALAEARQAKSDSIAIDVVPIDSRVPAYIARVDAPMSAHAGAPVVVRVAVNGTANERLRLTVARDGAELDSRRIVLDDSGTAAVEITDHPQRAGVNFYRATLIDDRMGLTLSESGAATSVDGKNKVLMLSEQGHNALPLAAASLEVVNIRPDDMPDSRDGLSAFGTIVIDAVPPHRLSARQLDAIAAAVSLDGAGLLFLGSRESLDASEFPPGAFSDALPIDFTALPNQPSASASLALLVDISGSMASTSDGVTKIAAARDAIVRALAIVPRTDAVEVIGFAAQPTVLIAPSDSREPAAIAEKLKSLSPSGSTALAPAVVEAAAWLKRSSAQRRRMLLVTDGKTSVSDARATRDAVAGQSIEVSVVTIGRDAEREWLTELAASTGGRAFFPERLTDLAREVAREAGHGASGREINEPFVVRNGAHPLAPGGLAPSLGGYIAGRLRDGATAAWKSQTDDAVLAAWPRGIGRVAVFASDLAGPWGLPLRNWRGNPSFWPRVMEWVSRGHDAEPFDAAFAVSNGAPRLVVDLTDRGARGASVEALPSVTATVAAPGGQTVMTSLHPMSPTRFEGAVPIGEAGDYRATIAIRDPASGSETRAARGWYWTGDRESGARGVNLPLLEEIARISGGRVLPVLGASVDATETVFGLPRTRGRVNAAPWLLLAALVMLSADYIRRAAEV
jgi:Mg-chelatase subunit ChlD